MSQTKRIRLYRSSIQTAITIMSFHTPRHQCRVNKAWFCISTAICNLRQVSIRDRHGLVLNIDEIFSVNRTLNEGLYFTD